MGKQIDEMIQSGLALYKKSDLEGARHYWEKAVKLDPKNAQLWHNLGSLNEGEGNLEESARCYEKAISIDPSFDPAYEKAWKVWADLGDYDKAEICLKKHLLRHPDDAEGWATLGLIVSEYGDYESAIVYHKRALDLSPKMAEVWYNLALDYYEVYEDTEQVNKWLDKALQIDSKLVPAIVAKGELALDKGDPVNAGLFFRRAVGLVPSYAPAWVSLAVVYSQYLDEPEAAVFCCEKALEIDPEEEDVMDSLLDACEDIVSFSDKDPDTAAGLITLGVAHYHLGDTGLAKKYLKKARELDPENKTVWRRLGNVIKGSS